MNTCVLLFQKNLVKSNLDKKEETKMTFEELKEIIAEILGADEADITPEANLIEDLEADSLSIMELHMSIIFYKKHKIRFLKTLVNISQKTRFHRFSFRVLPLTTLYFSTKKEKFQRTSLSK